MWARLAKEQKYPFLLKRYQHKDHNYMLVNAVVFDSKDLLVHVEDLIKENEIKAYGKTLIREVMPIITKAQQQLLTLMRELETYETEDCYEDYSSILQNKVKYELKADPANFIATIYKEDPIVALIRIINDPILFELKDLLPKKYATVPMRKELWQQAQTGTLDKVMFKSLYAPSFLKRVLYMRRYSLIPKIVKDILTPPKGVNEIEYYVSVLKTLNVPIADPYAQLENICVKAFGVFTDLDTELTLPITNYKDDVTNLELEYEYGSTRQVQSKLVKSSFNAEDYSKKYKLLHRLLKSGISALTSTIHACSAKTVNEKAINSILVLEDKIEVLLDKTKKIYAKLT